MTEAAHSRIGASSLYRWRACPGSVRLSKDMPNKSSVYAAEGSVAHKVAEQRLLQKLGRLTSLDPEWIDVGSKVVHDGHEIEVTDDMLTAVDFYVDTIWTHAQKPGCELLIEQRFDLSCIHPGMFGTSDAVVIDTLARVVTVYDLKFGAGIAVDAEDNEQMQFYAVGALLKSGASAHEIEVVIVQPRAFHPRGPVRRWKFPAVAIFEFIADLKAAAEATERADAPFAAGDHCRFCPAAPVCTTLKDFALTMAQQEFGPAAQGDKVPQYDPDKLNEVLRALPTIEAWMNSVSSFARSEALAGRGSSGHKLVRGRGSRAVTDPEGLKTWLGLMYGVDESRLFHPPEMLSIAQIEELKAPEGGKVLDKDARKAVGERFVRVKPGGLILAPSEDPRPAVNPSAEAQTEFTATPSVT